MDNENETIFFKENIKTLKYYKAASYYFDFFSKELYLRSAVV